MTKKTWQAPYDLDGNLMHYPETQRRGQWPDLEFIQPDWRDPAPFTAHLTYQGYKRGRSAAYFEWADEQGRTFPMFLKDLDAILRSTEVGPGGVTGTWAECKRGQNYGIQLMQDEEATGDH